MVLFPFLVPLLFIHLTPNDEAPTVCWALLSALGCSVSLPNNVALRWTLCSKGWNPQGTNPYPRCYISRPAHSEGLGK